MKVSIASRIPSTTALASNQSKPRFVPTKATGTRVLQIFFRPGEGAGIFIPNGLNDLFLHSFLPLVSKTTFTEIRAFKNPVAARRLQHLQMKKTNEKPNPYPSLGEKGALLACLWLGLPIKQPVRTLDVIVDILNFLPPPPVVTTLEPIFLRPNHVGDHPFSW